MIVQIPADAQTLLHSGRTVFVKEHFLPFSDEQQIRKAVLMHVEEKTGYAPSELEVWCCDQQHLWAVRLKKHSPPQDDEKPSLGPEAFHSAWLSGLFSAGGYFGATVHRVKDGVRRYPYMQFEGSREVCDYIFAITGAGKVTQRGGDRYRWTVTGSHARELMTELRPHVVGDRALRLAAALSQDQDGNDNEQEEQTA